MATEDFVIQLFCLVDDRLDCRHKHPQAQLWPSELVTIGLRFALKGSSFRSFSRWLERDYGHLFGGLPRWQGCSMRCCGSITSSVRLTPGRISPSTPSEPN